MEEIRKKFDNLSPLDIKILETSLQAFEERGFYGVNVDDIAAQLEIGKGTIYRHFGNKLMLFISIVMYIFHLENKEERSTSLSDNFYESMDIYFKRVIKYGKKWGNIFQSNGSIEARFALQNELDKNPEMRKLFSYLMEMQSRVQRKLENIIKNGIKQGIVSADISPFVSAAIIHSSLIGFMRTFEDHCRIQSSMGEKPQYTLDEGLKELKKYTFRALGVPVKGDNV